jgi:hypothetical protein
LLQTETEFPNQTPTTGYIQTPVSKKWGKPLQGPNTTKKARMEQMGTSDEGYQTFWGPKHEQRPKAGNTLMGSKVIGPATTETTDVTSNYQCLSMDRPTS